MCSRKPSLWNQGNEGVITLPFSIHDIASQAQENTRIVVTPVSRSDRDKLVPSNWPFPQG